MPAKSERQRRFMCADLGRARAGKPTQTGMSIKQLKEFCEHKVASHKKPGRKK
jgi:hypothetical protein